MRIIGGKFKGKKIFFLKSSSTRPLKDSVKENIFNILTHSNLLNIKIKESFILDLYSGIGSFGLECISRDAKKIFFVEKQKVVAEVLKNNLSNLGVQNKGKVIINELHNFIKNNVQKFDIIFLDPPYVDNSYLDELKFIKEKKIYKNNHIIIIHRDKKTKDNLEDIIHPLITKQYGRSKIIFAKFLR